MILCYIRPTICNREIRPTVILYWDVTFLVAGFLKLAGFEYAKWI